MKFENIRRTSKGDIRNVNVVTVIDEPFYKIIRDNLIKPQRTLSCPVTDRGFRCGYPYWGQYSVFAVVSRLPRYLRWFSISAGDGR